VLVAAASQAAVLEDERKHAIERVLRPSLEELVREIARAGHCAEIAVMDSGEIEFRFTPKHSIATKPSTGALPKVVFAYSTKDRVLVSHLSGNGVADRDGPRIPPRELTQERVEAIVLDLLRQVLPRGTY